MRTATGEVSIGFVSTYPPTICGIASYTASLLDSISRNRRSRNGLGVASLTDHSRISGGRDVVVHHRVGDASSLDRTVRALRTFDTVSIQHEFGIFGGRDGDEVLDLVDALDVPVAVTFHTVLDAPSPHQRLIVEQLAERADRIVVMSRMGADRLVRRHDVDADRIEVIPHGVHPSFREPSLVTGRRPLVLTWGLIGPGKGLEAAIRGVARLQHLEPLPRYVIAGATHPHVLETMGESYRNGLKELVGDLGLTGIVEFDDRYRDRAALARLVRSADMVVLPYESLEQVTSGVLVEAIAAGKPVVATRFPHAIELLEQGAGITVPHADPDALGEALAGLLSNPARRARMANHARRLGDGWLWSTIGRRFEATMSTLTDRSPDHAREVSRVGG